MKKIFYTFLTAIALLGDRSIFADYANGGATDLPYVFTNNGGTLVVSSSYTGLNGSTIPFAFTDNGGTTVVNLGWYDPTVPESNSSYVRYSDYIKLQSNIEKFNAMTDIGPISWTASADGGVITLSHFQKLVDKLILIGDTSAVRATFPNGIFLDASGASIPAPDFSSNIVFHPTVFENEYLKIIRANNLLQSFIPAFNNFGGTTVTNFTLANLGGTTVSNFTTTNSGGTNVTPFVFH